MLRGQHRHVLAHRRHHTCRFQADQPPAHTDHARGGGQRGAQLLAVSERAQAMHARGIGILHRQPTRYRTRAEREPCVRERAAIVQMKLPRGSVDAGRAPPTHHRDAAFGVEVARPVQEFLVVENARQIELGEMRALVGRHGLVAEHRDRAPVALASQ